MMENEDDVFDDLFGDDTLFDDAGLEPLNAAPSPLASHVDIDPTEDEMEYTYQPPSYARPRSSSAEEFNDSDVNQAHDLLPQATAAQPTLSPRLEVIQKIEAVFQEMALVLLNERGTLSILLKTGARQTRRNAKAHTNQPCPSVSESRICFPGKTEREAWRFTVVTRILELIYEALQSDVVLSKRDIYYRDPALFDKQSHVDRYVDDIACTFGVTRAALNVSAVAKGLVAGAVTFCRRDGTTVNAAVDRDGMLVPSLKEILSVSMPTVQWILVVEKEATFRSIAASAFWKQISTSGVLVTAKGYPDLATRALLRLLSDPSPQNGFSSLPVHCLVDYDPDGLAILSTYKHGSRSLAHESADLQPPRLQWLGLRGDSVFSCITLDQSEQGLLVLSARDRRKATLMLEWDVLGDDEEIRTELRTMLMLNVKAELQILDNTPNGMISLLLSALH